MHGLYSFVYAIILNIMHLCSSAWVWLKCISFVMLVIYVSRNEYSCEMKCATLCQLQRHSSVWMALTFGPASWKISSAIFGKPPAKILKTPADFMAFALIFWKFSDRLMKGCHGCPQQAAPENWGWNHGRYGTKICLDQTRKLFEALMIIECF